jgi:hypothetical protein
MAVSQRLIPTGERSSVQTRIAATEGKRFVVRADEKLTAFVELESTIRAAERPEDCEGREIKLDKLSRIM